MVAPPVHTVTIEQFHDFFLLAGTAAATLMGLLFVSISLHLEMVVHDRGRHLNAMAWESFYGFIEVLAISLMFLVPETPLRMLGIQLITLGSIRLGIMLINSRHLLGPGDAVVTRKVLIRRFLPHVVANVFLILVGRKLITGTMDSDGVSMLVTTIILLIITATGSAWDLMIRIGRLKMLQSREAGQGIE